MPLFGSGPELHHRIKTASPPPSVELVSLVGEGIYGKVYKARCLEYDSQHQQEQQSSVEKICAVKCIKLQDESEGIPASVLREIGLLQVLHHPNIIELRSFSVDLKASTIYLIFDFYIQDLSHLIALYADQGCLGGDLIKNILRGILHGVAYLHSHKILHRDLKPQNILLNSDCTEIRIADFGLAREIGIPTGPLAVDVVTLWYRAPEALLGSTAYAEPLDVWSIGCILLEMLRGAPLVTGSNPEDQICRLFAIFGAPDDTSWPGVCDLPRWKSHMQLVSRVVPLQDLVPPQATSAAAAVDMAASMLKLCPDKRPSCNQALTSLYLSC